MVTEAEVAGMSTLSLEYGKLVFGTYLGDPLYLLLIPYMIGQPFFAKWCEKTQVLGASQKIFHELFS